MVVTVSHAGYVKRNPVSLYRAQRRGGRGRTGAGDARRGLPRGLFVASTHSYLLVFSDKGRVYWLKVHEIPQAGRAARGKPIVNLVQLSQGEKVAAILPVRRLPEPAGSGEEAAEAATEGAEPAEAAAPRRGRGSSCSWRRAAGSSRRPGSTQFARPRAAGIIALGIEDGDELIAARLTDGKSHVLLSTAQGMAIRFEESDVRPMGRTAYGVKGITLEDGRRGRLGGGDPGGAAGGRARADDPHRHRERVRQAHRARRVPGPEPRREGHHHHQDDRAERPGGRGGARHGRRGGDAHHERRDAHPNAGEGDQRHRPEHPGRPAHHARVEGRGGGGRGARRGDDAGGRGRGRARGAGGRGAGGERARGRRSGGEPEARGVIGRPRALAAAAPRRWRSRSPAARRRERGSRRRTRGATPATRRARSPATRRCWPSSAKRRSRRTPRAVRCKALRFAGDVSYLELGDYTGAISYYRRIVSLYPGGKEAREARVPSATSTASASAIRSRPSRSTPTSRRPARRRRRATSSRSRAPTSTLENWSQARTEARILREKWPDHALADEAQLLTAQAWSLEKRDDEALARVPGAHRPQAAPRARGARARGPGPHPRAGGPLRPRARAVRARPAHPPEPGRDPDQHRGGHASRRERSKPATLPAIAPPRFAEAPRRAA